MKRRNWKTCVPSSIQQALEWSLEYARERKNLGVERIAERMGMANHWTLYKWINEGRLPAVTIPNFEHSCGINLVSRWLAASDGHMLVPIPTGRTCGADDLQQLQEALHATTGALMSFYKGSQSAEETLASIQVSLELLAGQRANVQQYDLPQLALGEHSDD